MADFIAIYPEIGLVVLAAVVLFFSMKSKSDDSNNQTAWVTFYGLIAILALSFLVSNPTDAELVFGGMLRHDGLAFIFRVIFLLAAAFTVLFSIGKKGLGDRGEFYVLLVISTLGMSLVGASADMVMLFVALETATIPLYVMAGFLNTDDRSIEAGFKYLLFGAMTSAFMLYGFSLVFGFTGQTNLTAIAQSLGDMPSLALIGSAILILVGLGFKTSMVPFHFWTPDVYEGAPTPVTGFLSTASKAAGLAAIIRVFMIAYPPTSGWVQFMAVMAAITMTLGNLIALRQTSIKRLLAYSSIAHAGYLLMGVASASVLGVSSVLYYLLAYLFTNLAAFGFVVVVSKQLGSDELTAYHGLSRRNPYLAFGMMFIFLSLAGIPPLGGFIGKLLVFAAAVESNLVWLAVVGVINAVVSLFYYLTVLKYVYLYRNEEDESPLVIAKPHAFALTVSVALVIILGIVVAPGYNWATAAAMSFVP
jgi:NADH-quinone oxidoreductase subunit N